MHSNSSKWKVYIWSVAALALLFLVVYSTVSIEASKSLVNTKLILPIQRIILPGQSKVGLPLRLKIPAIRVDAPMEYAAVTPQGAMEVPKGPNNVAWFQFGPRPGEPGNAVLAGHEGWKNGIPAVFDNLYKLKPGDKLYIESENGIIFTFIIRELKTYDQNDNASSVFASNDGKIHLNLVTCKGIWNKNKKSYSQRLVVFADKE